MAVKEREYMLSVDRFNEPVIAEGQHAIGMLLIRLILLDPGSDPLHPEMGVGIRQYRYSMNTLDELKRRVEEQISTYLPMFNSATVGLVITPDKLININITIDQTTYVYDSHKTPYPIALDDLMQ